MTIIKHFSVNFVFMWMSQKLGVDNFVRESAGKDPMIVQQMPNYIHFNPFLDQDKIDYCNLQAEWGGSTAGDKLKAMQVKLASMTFQLSKVKQQVSLSNSKREGNKEDPKCFKCGSLNHFTNSPVCPKFKPKTNGKNDGDSNSGGGKSGSNGKRKPPAAGKPTAKTINGWLMHHCSKCRSRKGKWTFHTTNEHKGSSVPAFGSTPLPASANIASIGHVNPSLWME